MFNKEVYVERRNELRKLMEGGVVVLFGNNEAPNNYPNNAYYPFRQARRFCTTLVTSATGWWV